METIRNFTPHPINIIRDGKEVRTFASEGLVRLKTTTEAAGNANGIPLTKTRFGAPEGLPEKKAGVLLIVSQLIKSALPERHDLVVPSEIVRNKTGNIVGCQSLGI